MDIEKNITQNSNEANNDVFKEILSFEKNIDLENKRRSVNTYGKQIN